MPDGYLEEHPRSPLDYFHFALASLGFFVAVTGVVLSSVSVAICGLVVLAWGLAYFKSN